jgi:sugar lactone lactonase YvrE
MAFEIGQRVKVLPGVSHRTDAGSIDVMHPDGHSRAHLVGTKGEIVALKDGMVLVDDQIENGKPRGKCNMREWFKESEVAPG